MLWRLLAVALLVYLLLPVAAAVARQLLIAVLADVLVPHADRDTLRLLAATVGGWLRRTLASDWVPARARQ